MYFHNISNKDFFYSKIDPWLYECHSGLIMLTYLFKSYYENVTFDFEWQKSQTSHLNLFWTRYFGKTKATLKKLWKNICFKPK